MQLWIWAVLLLVLGIGLAILEVFFTSAGILAFLSATAIATALALAFHQSFTAGFLVLLATVVGVPTAIVLAFKFFPKTPMGRRMLLGAPSSEDVLPDNPEKERLKGLVGRTGRAKSQMLLSGVVLIDGQSLDAVSESLPVEAGQTVQVIRVQGRRLVVRPVDEDTAAASSADPLKQSYDDPFDLPNA